jgi:hypothetical protein
MERLIAEVGLPTIQLAPVVKTNFAFAKLHSKGQRHNPHSCAHIQA